MTMPELATCSYGAHKPAMGQGVRITLGRPHRPDQRRWPHVALLDPGYSYFRADAATFARKYRQHLDHVGVEAIRHALIRAADDTNADRLVLCCFERRITGPADCHRRQFADWWLQLTGQRVPELDASRQLRFGWTAHDAIEITPPEEEP